MKLLNPLHVSIPQKHRVKLLPGSVRTIGEDVLEVIFRVEPVFLGGLNQGEEETRSICTVDVLTEQPVLTSRGPGFGATFTIKSFSFTHEDCFKPAENEEEPAL